MMKILSGLTGVAVLMATLIGGTAGLAQTTARSRS